MITSLGNKLLIEFEYKNILNKDTWKLFDEILCIIITGKTNYPIHENPCSLHSTIHVILLYAASNIVYIDIKYDSTLIWGRSKHLSQPSLQVNYRFSRQEFTTMVQEVEYDPTTAGQGHLVGRTFTHIIWCSKLKDKLSYWW